VAEKDIKKVLITGSAGFLGANLERELTSLGYEVVGVDNLSWGNQNNILKSTKFYHADCRNKQRMDNIFYMERPDIVFHFSADATESRSQFTPVSATENNLQSAVNVFTSAIKYKIKRIIFTSSIAVYGDQVPPFTEDMNPKPIDIYAVNKRASEEVLKILGDVHDMEYVIFRPYNIIGELQNLSDPYRNVAGIFMNRIMQGKAPLIYGDGTQVRAFSYIKNILPCFVKAMTDEVSGETFNIGPERPVTVNELSKIVLKAMNSDLVPEHIEERPHEVKMAYCNTKKAREILGYEDKYTLEEGIERMAKWAKEQGPQEFIYLDKLELPNKKAPEVWTNKKI